MSWAIGCSASLLRGLTCSLHVHHLTHTRRLREVEPEPYPCPLHSPPPYRCLLLALVHAGAHVRHGHEQSSLLLLCCTPQARSHHQLSLPSLAAASSHCRSHPRVRRTTRAPPLPLLASRALTSLLLPPSVAPLT
jgi:hypothetical protein